MRLGVHAADELTVVEDGQRVVAVHALGARRVDLDPVAEAEEPLRALAVPEERVERGEQGRAARRGASPGGAPEGRQILREGEPPAAGALDLDLDDLAGLEEAPEGRPTDAGPHAREGEVAREVRVGRPAHRVERPRDVPRPERVGREGLAGRPGRQDALGQVVPLLEVRPRMHSERPGHPEVVERVLGRLPAPPAAAPARAAMLEVRGARRPAGPDGVRDEVERLAVAPEPGGPPGVAEPVVQHRPAPRARDATPGPDRPRAPSTRPSSRRR